VISISTYKDYIYINGKLFQFIDRQHTKFGLNKKIERTLNNTGWQDHTGNSKHRWIFTLDQDSRGVDRLESIWDINNSSLTLIDWDDKSYTVAITNDFSDPFNGDDNFTIQLSFEEL
jgi:hypothetical protein